MGSGNVGWQGLPNKNILNYQYQVGPNGYSGKFFVICIICIVICTIKNFHMWLFHVAHISRVDAGLELEMGAKRQVPHYCDH